jgi:hypothetical protein
MNSSTSTKFKADETKEQANSSPTEHLSEEEDDSSSVYSYTYSDDEEDLVDVAFLPAEETFEERDDVQQNSNFNEQCCKGSDHIGLTEFDSLPSARVSSIRQLQPEPLHNREKAECYCRDCGSENHAPVSDCTRVAQFLKQRQELPTFSPAVIQCCMEYVVHLVRSTQFGFNDDKVARARCLNNAWNVRKSVIWPRTRKHTETTLNEYISNVLKRHRGQPLEPEGRLSENSRLLHHISAPDEDQKPAARKDNKYEEKDNDQPTDTQKNQNKRLPKDPEGKELSVQKVLRQNIVADDDQKPAAPKVEKHEGKDKNNDQQTATQMIQNELLPEHLEDNELAVQQKSTNGNDAFFQCVICFDDGLPHDEMMSMKCGHAFCRKCWYKFFQNMLQDGRVAALRTTCPTPDCRVVVTADDIERVAPDLVPLYEKIVLDSFIQAHKQSLRLCPGDNCDWVAVVPSAGLFEDATILNYCCGHCQARFCFRCGLPPHERPCDIRNNDRPVTHAAVAHGGLPPDERPCDNVIDDRSVTHAAVAHCGLPPDGRPSAGMIVDRSVTHAAVAHGGLPPDERSSTKTIDDRSVTHAVVANPVVVAQVGDHMLKQCPNCEIDIQKIGGCNRMHCTSCGHFFCWLCLGDYVAYGKHFCGKDNVRDPLPEIRQHGFAAVTRKGTYIVSTAFVETALSHATIHHHLLLQNDSSMVGEANATLQKLIACSLWTLLQPLLYSRSKSKIC